MTKRVVGSAAQRNPTQQGNQGRVMQRAQFSSSENTGATLVKQDQLADNTCKLLELVGYNSSGSARYIMLFDTELAAIPNGAVPTLVIPVPQNKATFSWAFSWDFQKGCVVGSSSTETTFTETGAADLFYAVELEITI